MQSHGVDVRKTHVSRLERSGTFQLTERLTSPLHSHQGQAERISKDSASWRNVESVSQHTFTLGVASEDAE